MTTQVNINCKQTTDMDLAAWPSSYYGKTRRIDLAKFYQDILKETTTSSSNDDDVTMTNQSKKKKSVTFSTEPPTVYAYDNQEEEEDDRELGGLLPNSIMTKSLFFDDGWPGRTRTAMNTTGFIDFKSKIEAKLGAINDPSLILEIENNSNTIAITNNNGNSSMFHAYYRHRKSPLVQKLDLRPIPNNTTSSTTTSLLDTPSSCPEEESPVTPEDDIPDLLVSSSSSSSLLLSSSAAATSNQLKWLKSLSKIKK